MMEWKGTVPDRPRGDLLLVVLQGQLQLMNCFVDRSQRICSMSTEIVSSSLQFFLGFPKFANGPANMRVLLSASSIVAILILRSWQESRSWSERLLTRC